MADSRRKRRYASDEYPESIIESLKIGNRSISLLMDYPDVDTRELPLPNVKLSSLPAIRVWELDRLTTVELDAAREFINRVFDLAREVTVQRDANAEAAAAEGRIFRRSIRPAPLFIKLREPLPTRLEE